MLQFATRHPEKVFAERQGDFGGSLTFFAILLVCQVAASTLLRG